jgi:type III pantothenate kinase
MLLAVDIGNSTINMGIFAKKILIATSRIPSHPGRASNLYKNNIKAFLQKNSIEMPLGGVIISSVVRQLTGIFSNSLKDLGEGKPIIADASLKTGLVFEVKKPEEVGSDRISNVVAAAEMFGSPVAVIDFGTATSISAVKGRRFVGGSILPGINLMEEALYAGTSRLPRVKMPDVKEGARTPAIGKDTAMCIISGVLYGTAGAAERIVSEMEKEEACRFKVVTTGGHSAVMARFLKRKHCRDSDLTLKGLRLIYERNVRCMS